MTDALNILGTLTSEPRGNEQIFEAQYHAQDPIITDHRVYGFVVVPGSLHLARLQYAVFNVMRAKSFHITDILFTLPLIILEDKTKLVRLVITNDHLDEYAFKIISADIDNVNKEWILHAHGHFIINQCNTQVTQNLSTIIARCTQEFSIATFDNYFASNKLQYGIEYKWIERINYFHNEAVGYMRDFINTNEERWQVLQPGQIDCAFQNFISIIYNQLDLEKKEAWILGGIKEIHFLGNTSKRVICYNILLNYDEFSADSNKGIGDIYFYDDQNTLLAKFLGVLVIKASATKIAEFIGAQ